MRLVWILGSTSLLMLGLAAGCGDDDDPVRPPGTGGDAGSAGAPTGGGGTGGQPPGVGGNGGMGGMGGLGLACDPQGDAACENQTDCPLVTGGQLQDRAYVCAGDCDGEADEEQCAIECISDELDSTEECSTCYAELVACSNENCATECVNPSADSCKECLQDADCADDFEECSGIAIE